MMIAGVRFVFILIFVHDKVILFFIYYYKCNAVLPDFVLVIKLIYLFIVFRFASIEVFKFIIVTQLYVSR